MLSQSKAILAMAMVSPSLALAGPEVSCLIAVEPIDGCRKGQTCERHANRFWLHLEDEELMTTWGGGPIGVAQGLVDEISDKIGFSDLNHSNATSHLGQLKGVFHDTQTGGLTSVRVGYICESVDHD